jgi:hypothetical protein
MGPWGAGVLHSEEAVVGTWLGDLEVSYRLSADDTLPPGLVEALLERRVEGPEGWLEALARRADLTHEQQVMVVNDPGAGWMVLGRVAEHSASLAPEVLEMALVSSMSHADTAPLLANPGLSHQLQRRVAAQLASEPWLVMTNLSRNPDPAPDLREAAFAGVTADGCSHYCWCSALATRADLSAEEALALASHDKAERALAENSSLGEGTRRALLERALEAGSVPGVWGFVGMLEEDEVDALLDTTTGNVRSGVLAAGRVSSTRQALAVRTSEGLEMLAHNPASTRSTQEAIAEGEHSLILVVNPSLDPGVARTLLAQEELRDLGFHGLLENPALEPDLVVELLARAREVGDRDAVTGLTRNPACPLGALLDDELEARHYPGLLELAGARGCELEALEALGRTWEGTLEDLLVTCAELGPDRPLA